MSRQRLALVALIVTALAGLLTVGTWASIRMWAGPSQLMMGGGYGSGMMGGPEGSGMMGGGYLLPGDGRQVDSLAAARQRAQLFADRLGLRAGEVMQFSNGLYVELRTAEGGGASEVLVDPADGSVRLEYGPAMMWNTRYGMHAGVVPPTATRVSETEASRLAARWLRDQRPGMTVGEPEKFPGYYTLHTLRKGKIAGMMSVNSYTGAVWYHTWHGQYMAMSEE